MRFAEMPVNGGSVRATARAARLGVVAGGPVAGLALLALLSATAHPMAPVLVLVGVVVAAPAGYLLDDPAADLLAASPTTLARRRLARLALGLPVLIAGWLIIVSRSDFLEGHARLDLTAVHTEVLAMVTATLAIAAIAARRGDAHPGVSASLGLVVLVATVFLAHQAVPASWPVPDLQPNLHHRRWWWVTATAVVVLWWSSRDPLAGALGPLRRSAGPASAPPATGSRAMSRR